MSQRVVILGSTGSVGATALSVAATLPDRIQVIGLAAARNAARLVEQAARFGVPTIALADPAAAREARTLAPSSVRVLSGPEGVAELAGGAGEADLVLCAIVGAAGLVPALAAVEAGRTLAVATKETLVIAGEIVTAAARRAGRPILPVDSEHSAIFQCLQGRSRAEVRRIVLTASGGPFRGRSAGELGAVTVDEALRHPRWSMGRKISVDSATMMNKGLEILEARWLFDQPIERIEVVVHPESIVHSMVELVDGTLMAQLSPPDMRYPVQYALTWPDRVAGDLPPAAPERLGTLHFESPDSEAFPSLDLARAAGQAGGTMPAVLNAANETAVQRFLEGRIPFPGIWRAVERTMDAHRAGPADDLDAVTAADAWARKEAERWC